MKLTDLFPVAQEVEITLPDGTPTDIRFKVLGFDNPEFQRLAMEWGQRIVEDKKMGIADLKRRDTELLAACVKGWTNLEDEQGPIPYSHEMAVNILSKPEVAFIYEQLEGFVAKRTNFFRKGGDTAGGTGEAASAAKHAEQAGADKKAGA